MGESLKLVHQKSDRYRAKGVALRYCQIARFQAFAEMQKQSSFGPKFARGRAGCIGTRKSRVNTVKRMQEPV
jgi:hypothetical protein